MPFPCPACQETIEQNPDRWLLRCAACGARVRSRAVEAGGGARVYDVEVVGEPSTRRRVEVPWTPGEHRRLEAWLLWGSILTLSLVAVLYALARWSQ